jgi:hypothetical protein
MKPGKRNRKVRIVKCDCVSDPHIETDMCIRPKLVEWIELKR